MGKCPAFTLSTQFKLHDSRTLSAPTLAGSNGGETIEKVRNPALEAKFQVRTAWHWMLAPRITMGEITVAMQAN